MSQNIFTKNAAELAEDAELARRALWRDEERIPVQVVDRLIESENPVRVWREYRRLSRRQLAETAGIATAYLSQIETGRRGGSSKVLRAIATALDVDLDDIVRESQSAFLSPLRRPSGPRPDPRQSQPWPAAACSWCGCVPLGPRWVPGLKTPRDGRDRASGSEVNS